MPPKIAKTTTVPAREKSAPPAPPAPVATAPAAPRKPAAAKKKGARFSLFRVPLSQKIFFAENLRVMIRAGLSYTEAFKTLVLQAENKNWRAILQDIADRIERGETFAAALTHHEKTFPPLFINMIRVGEVSGTLEKSLEELVMQMKKDQAIRNKIRGAMMYPTIILSATLLIAVGMLIFVLPRIVSIFADIKAELPFATRVLIAVSNFVSHNGPIVGLAALALIVAVIALARSRDGRNLVHAGLLKVWIIGPIVKKVNLARATRTLGTLLRTGIPVIEAFQVSADVLGNVHYQKAFRATAEELRRGTTIGESFAKRRELFPALVIQMTTVGEEAGKLDEMLNELAVFYEAQVDETLSNLTQIIEPVLILMLGIGVGGIAIAIIQPIYALSENF